MSRVSNLCLLLIFSCIKSLARVLELLTLYWFSRCRWLLRMVFSFCCFVCGGRPIVNHRLDGDVGFVQFQ